MNVFVDTSAFYALSDRSDEMYSQARKVYQNLLDKEALLITSSYVIVETLALMQRRLGLVAVSKFIKSIEGWLPVIWVAEKVHQSAMQVFLKKGDKKLSFVDCVTFEIMRQGSIGQVFAFDEHFGKEGFEILT